MFADISDYGFTVIDSFNPLKVFKVKRYNCGHYYVKQYVAGTPVNTKAVKMTESQVYKLGV